MGSLIEIIGLTTGIIGAFTGVISLIWHISKSKPRLKLKSAYFVHRVEKGTAMKEGYDNVGVEIILRNLGHRSTTVDSLWITYGSHQIPPFFQEVTLPAGTSKTLSYSLNFEEGWLEKTFPKGEIEIGLNIIHTFGRIKKEAKTNLKYENYGF